MVDKNCKSYTISDIQIGSYIKVSDDDETAIYLIARYPDDASMFLLVIVASTDGDVGNVWTSVPMNNEQVLKFIIQYRAKILEQVTLDF